MCEISKSNLSILYDAACEHTHGEHCACGCDHKPHDHHEHEHHHDEKECCEDEHDHDHEHKKNVSITYHDDAVIGSLKFILKMEYDESVKIMSERMLRVAESVEKEGGLIGHIKSFVRYSDRGCMLSLTYAQEPNAKPIAENYCDVEVVNIVFGVAGEWLEEELEYIYSDYLKTE